MGNKRKIKPIGNNGAQPLTMEELRNKFCEVKKYHFFDEQGHFNSWILPTRVIGDKDDLTCSPLELMKLHRTLGGNTIITHLPYHLLTGDVSEQSDILTKIDKLTPTKNDNKHYL